MFATTVIVTLLLAAAAGLLVGLLWSPLGVVTTACVSIYFLVAVAFHARAMTSATPAPRPGSPCSPWPPWRSARSPGNPVAWGLCRLTH